jgi:WD40 repeat protein/serine/threonine protein kinase
MTSWKSSSNPNRVVPFGRLIFLGLPNSYYDKRLVINMDDRSGQILKGYEIRERIGVGGFGSVYRAYQPLVDREVAIKVIVPDFANQFDFIRHFEAEARLVAKLEHPYIVPLFDFWRDPDGAYLVMRLLSSSLSDRLKDGSLGLELTARMLDQMTAALSFAHNSGIVHRDIKPGNILLDDMDNFYLTDFGLATLIDSDQDEGIVQGSFAYIAPEQLQEQAPTASSDVYSLGIVLYEALTGQHPFGNLQASELISRQLLTSLPDLNLTRSDLPEALNIIIQRATLKESEDRYQEIEYLADSFRKAIINEDIKTQELSVVDIHESPYKGLLPFEEGDAENFFGRNTLIQQLLDRMEEPNVDNRFLAVVGPSGSGKSSVIHAGLLPQLNQSVISGSENWLVIDMVPGYQPLNNLEAALLSVAANPIPNLKKQLKKSDGLLLVTNAVLDQGDADSELLLIIDQFEEVFTLAENESQIKHFLELLRVASTSEGSRIRVIIGLRADFYDRPLLYDDFAGLIQSRTQAVIPLTKKELELAIVGPARRIGLDVEEELVNKIIADVREEPGALPLLQYALSEVFDRRDGHTLTLAVYEESGGVLGALARRADEVFDQLDGARKAVTKQIFLRLVTLGEGTEDTRRRVGHSELLSVLEQFGAGIIHTSPLKAVLNVFGQYRLLTFDHDRETREPTIEVAHEALIRTWSRLREWLDESRDDIRLQRLLAFAAGEWRNNGQQPNFLLHGGRLAQFDEWKNTTGLALTQDEHRFLDASIAERESLRIKEEARKVYEYKLERRARQRLQVIAGVMSVAFVVVVFLLIAIFNQSKVVQEERDNAERHAAIAMREAEVSRSLALANGAEAVLRGDEPHPDVGLALAIEAVNIENPPPEANLALANAAGISRIRQRYNESANVAGVAISPDGQTVLLALVNGTISLRDIGSGEIINSLVGHNDSVNSVEFSPDGLTALSASRDGKIILWDIASGEVLDVFEGHEAGVNRVVFSPDGQTMLSAADDQMILLWNIESGEIVSRYEGHVDEVYDVAFSLDATMILSASADQSAILWDLETGEILHHFEGLPRPARAVEFHPDGKTAIFATDKDIYRVDLESGEILQMYVGHASAMTRVSFNPDGSRILSSTDSVELFLWDTESGVLLHRFDGHRGPIMDSALTPDGLMAVTGAVDRSAILWDIENDDIFFHMTGHGRSVRSVAYSPGGETFISASKDTSMILWDAETGERIRVFEGSDQLRGVVYSPDGQYALASTSNSTMILWDVETAEIVRVYEGHEDDVYKADFSPDGSRIISASGDRTLILWDVESGEALRTFTGHEDALRDVAYSPNGDTVLSGGLDGIVILWDVETGEIIRRMEEHTSEVLGVAYSPDGMTALSGSGDNTLILWDLETGELLHRYRGHNGAILGGVAFSPDGKLAVSGATDTTIILWNVESGEVLRRFMGHQELINDVAFSPDGRTALSASSDDTVMMWDVASFSDGSLDWVRENRYVAELTCDQHETYHIEPLCE